MKNRTIWILVLILFILILLRIAFQLGVYVGNSNCMDYFLNSEKHWFWELLEK